MTWLPTLPGKPDGAVPDLGASHRPGSPDRSRRGIHTGGQRGDQPRHCRPKQPPEQLGLGADHGDIREAVPAKCDRSRKVEQDLARVMGRSAGTHTTPERSTGPAPGRTRAICLSSNSPDEETSDSRIGSRTRP